MQRLKKLSVQPSDEDEEEEEGNVWKPSAFLPFCFLDDGRYSAH